jgi:hypothetical protein
MSTSIPTYNILVAFNKEIFAELRQASKMQSLNSFLGSKKDFVLFTNVADNFLRLSHTYAFTSSNPTDNFSITLEILDPGRVFEQNYLANSLKQLLGNKTGDLFSSGDEIKKEVARLQKILDESDEKDPNFWANMGAARRNDQTLEGQLSKINNELEDLNSITKISISKEDEEAGVTQDQALKKFNDQLLEKENEFYKKRADYLQDIRKRLDQLQTPVSPTNIYISYGCGDNMENWAGPFLCTMGGVKIGFASDTGFRLITVVFTVNAQFPGLTPNDAAVFEFGKDVQVIAQVPLLFTATRDNATFETFFGGNASVLNPTVELSVEEKLKRQKQKRKAARISQNQTTPTRTDIVAKESGFDYHYIISECIKEYIKKATGNKSNPIVFLPDLNLLLAPLIDSHEAAYKFNGTNYLDSQTITLEVNGKVQTLAKNKFYCVAEVIKSLGFDITAQLTDTSEVITYNSDLLIGLNGTQDSNATAVERIAGHVGTGKNLYISLIKRGGESFMDPLKRVMSGMSVLQVIQPVFLIENNSDFIKEFQGFCDDHRKTVSVFQNKLRQKDPTAVALVREGGESVGISGRFEEEITINPQLPLVVFGDRTIIDRYFFGKIALEESGIFKFGYNNDPAKLQEDTSKAKVTDPVTSVFNYENLVAPRDSKYLSSDYQKIARKYFQKLKQDNCFNSYVLPKSQFAFENDDATRLRNSNIPIFKFGVADSNVLDLDIDVNTYYFAILNSVLYQTAELFRGSRGASVSTDDKFNALLSLDFNVVADIFKKFSVIKPDGTMGLTTQGAQKIKGRIPQLAQFNSEDIEALLTSLIALSGDKTVVKNLDWWKSENPAVFFLAMLSQLSNMAYKGTVRTLPFFHLSNSAPSINPALLFVKESSILGVNKTTSVSDTLNGLWSIYGYEHNIGKGEAYSTFHIMKDPRIALPNNLMPEGKKSTNNIEISDPTKE